MACENDSNCTCWSGCLAQNPTNPTICYQTCGNPDNTTTGLYNCVSGPCQSACTGTGSSSSSGGACAPAAGDSACTTCAKKSCCSDVTACAAEKACTCYVTCLGQGGSYTQCYQQCGQSQAFLSLAQCSGQSCQSECQ